MTETKDRTKQIKVVSNATEESPSVVLFEGLSAETKVELKAKWGENITVYYQQLYTTIEPPSDGNVQTYKQAIESIENVENISCLAYTEEEFLQYAKDNNYDPILWAYNQKDLDRKLNKTHKDKKKKVETKQSNCFVPNLAVYLFTSLSDLPEGNFPLVGLTKQQVNAAISSLEEEDFALAKYANENNLSINDEKVRQQQIEAVIFFAGSPNYINHLISYSKVRWIGGERQGLIKNSINSQTGQQVIMLIIDVTLPCNRYILTELGYFR